MIKKTFSSDVGSLPNNPAIEADLQYFIKKLQSADISSLVIATFSEFYRQFRSGKQGLVPESAITPLHPQELRSLNNLSVYSKHGEEALPHTVVIKLNGGLGTTMGCNGPKSLIEVKNGLHFLDITARQLDSFSRKTGTTPPLILMNSYNTDKESLEALQTYSDLPDSLPRSFLQNRFPRIDAETMLPVTWPDAPRNEWNPPGHGDIYTALTDSGLLKLLLEHKFRYAFISNSDNLGATLDTALLGYLSEESPGFLMEVTARTPMDRKGGHIARFKGGNLILRESIQCPENDQRYFQDIYRHRFFNTNNIWIDLAALDNLIASSEGTFRLPLLCNKKFIDATAPHSPLVYQLESAMGSALSVFPAAAAVSVPRSRFLPVKTCEELLLLRSDFYSVTDDFRIVPFSGSPEKTPEITLDSRYFGTVDQIDRRFGKGIPSLTHCGKFTVEGDVYFGSGCSITGAVTIVNRTDAPYTIPDDTALSEDLQIGN